MGKTLTFLAGAGTGAAVTYFLDPQGGADRRAMAKEKSATLKEKTATVTDKAPTSVKSGAGDATERAKAAAGKARGAVQGVAKKVPGRGETPDDVTLARTVESEIFRPVDAPKGSVSVNAENGVVFLRGEVGDAGWIERLESEAKQVQGVKEVRNLLHLPGTPAPAAPASQ
jgi:osmotically-inducible protein OsmY